LEILQWLEEKKAETTLAQLEKRQY